MKLSLVTIGVYYLSVEGDLPVAQAQMKNFENISVNDSEFQCNSKGFE